MDKNAFLTIIPVDGGDTHFHPYQSQSGRTECWENGHIAVPPKLLQKLGECGCYCDLVIKDGVLADLIPVAPPAPTEEEVRESYENKVVELIRQKYNPNDEAKMARQVLAHPNDPEALAEFHAYNDYVNTCREAARAEVYGG